MFENATTLQLHPGAVNETMLVLHCEIVQILRQQEGLIHLGLVSDPTNNRVTIISLWQTPRQARVIEAQAAYRRAVALLDPLMVNPGVQYWQYSQHLS